MIDEPSSSAVSPYTSETAWGIQENETNTSDFRDTNTSWKKVGYILSRCRNDGSLRVSRLGP